MMRIFYFLTILSCFIGTTLQAQKIQSYRNAGNNISDTFNNPSGAKFDVLPDGRLAYIKILKIASKGLPTDSILFCISYYNNSFWKDGAPLLAKGKGVDIADIALKGDTAFVLFNNAQYVTGRLSNHLVMYAANQWRNAGFDTLYIPTYSSINRSLAIIKDTLFIFNSTTMFMGFNQAKGIAYLDPTTQSWQPWSNGVQEGIRFSDTNMHYHAFENFDRSSITIKVSSSGIDTDTVHFQDQNIAFKGTRCFEINSKRLIRQFLHPSLNNNFYTSVAESKHGYLFYARADSQKLYTYEKATGKYQSFDVPYNNIISAAQCGFRQSVILGSYLNTLYIQLFNGKQLSKPLQIKLMAGPKSGMFFITAKPADSGVVWVSNADSISVYHTLSKKYSPPLAIQNVVKITHTARSIISGRIFHDLNKDGTLNGADYAAVEAMASLKNNDHFFARVSDDSGSFEIPLTDTGKFAFDVNYLNFKKYSYSIGKPISFYLERDTFIYDVNIPIIATTIQDLEIYETNPRNNKIRRGDTLTAQIHVTNVSHQSSKPFTAVIECDTAFIMKPLHPKAVLISNAIWSITDSLGALSKGVYAYKLIALPNKNQNGDIRKLQFTIAPYQDDKLSNNADTMIWTITSAYDPNIKNAQPEGPVKNKDIKQVDYYISFRNEGSDTAMKVVVIDTLLSSLYLNKVYLLDESHPYQIQVIDQSLVFTFPKIKLPPNAEDPQKSSGWLKFRLLYEEPWRLGEKYCNRASIYFDYEKPIVTNWACTWVIDTTISMQPKSTLLPALSIYPNPGTHLCTLVCNSPCKEQLMVTDITGKIIFEQPFYQSIDINTSLWPQGIYYMRCSNGAIGKWLKIE